MDGIRECRNNNYILRADRLTQVYEWLRKYEKSWSGRMSDLDEHLDCGAAKQTQGGTRPMKTMTCREMGGPCDLGFHGDTADEVIKMMDKHLREAVAGGDQTHQSALDAMKGRWKNPVKGMGWYLRTKKDFAALPEV